MKNTPEAVSDRIQSFLNRKTKQFPDIDNIARTIFRS